MRTQEQAHLQREALGRRDARIYGYGGRHGWCHHDSSSLLLWPGNASLRSITALVGTVDSSLFSGWLCSSSFRFSSTPLRLISSFSGVLPYRNWNKRLCSLRALSVSDRRLVRGEGLSKWHSDPAMDLSTVLKLSITSKQRYHKEPSRGFRCRSELQIESPEGEDERKHRRHMEGVEGQQGLRRYEK